MTRLLFRPVTPRVLALDALRETLQCDVAALPPQVAVLGHLADGSWVASALADPIHTKRLAWLVGLLQQLPGPLSRSTWWSLVCLDDGWREGVRYHPAPQWAAARWRPGDPFVEGTAPLLSEQRPVVLAFGRHRGDATAELVPESHWIWSRGYLRTRLELSFQDRPWRWKQARAGYAGGRNGRPESFRDPALTVDPRTHLEQLVRANDWAVDVTVGGSVSRRAQLARRVVLDVDGFARTWDAWAWKQLSRSAVVAQDSVWETFFTRDFVPGRDFVVAANDLSDLGDLVAALEADPARAHAVARDGRRRAREVYRRRRVLASVREQLEVLLLGEGCGSG